MSSTIRSDIEIAREAKMKPIHEVAKKLNIPSEEIVQYGPHKAKLTSKFVNSLTQKPYGKLILVTAMTPTAAGEGKTTVTIGLGDGLNRIGKKTAICLREPSLGPCFGVKGGAAGGGYSQVVPMEDINLHFTGDFHAITAANNLLAAMLDNHIYWGNELKIDQRRVEWARVLDMNDRALRNIVSSLGGVANGYPREDQFTITVASEIMAIFCLANDLKDLQKRIGDIIVARTSERKPITARDLKADGALTALLRDAFMPNIVQTMENNPTFIHGGPFANIAHGCNSLIATKTALRLADYVVTEAGFAADLGAEKFFDIKCRKGNLNPSAAVMVVTARAIKMQGGLTKDQLKGEDLNAIDRGFSNVKRHLENLKKFKVPVAVAINRFITDTDNELNKVVELCKSASVEAFICTHWADGSRGIEELAKKVVKLVDENSSQYTPLYELDLPLVEKIRKIAKDLYGASDIEIPSSVAKKLSDYETEGFKNLPVCMAKTQYSFSTDPKLLGAPSGHKVEIREVKLSAGAGFVVVITGEIMTMPGLPKVPAANNIGVDDKGEIFGLF